MARGPTPREGGRPALSVIEGRPDAPVRIALSLIHPRERIGIPVKDVVSIEPLAETTFFIAETRRLSKPIRFLTRSLWLGANGRSGLRSPQHKERDDVYRSAKGPVETRP